jgi:O-antigen/teichoic acid export membrane protein
MKLDNKEFFKLSFLYTAVAAVPPLLNIVIRPFIEGDGRLAPADFSQIEISETIISLVFIIATFAMTNSISRFYYDFIDNKSGYNKLVSSVFNSILARGLVLLVLAYIFKDYIGRIFTQPELQDFSSYGVATVIVGINRAINTTAFALYRNEKKVRIYLVISLLLGVFRSAFQVIGVFYFDMSFIGYVYGTCIGTTLISIIILYFIYRDTGFHYDRKILKLNNQYALPLFEYAFIAWGIAFADRYFLESSPTILGIYSQALIIGRGMEIILQGLQGASQPEMFRLMKDGIAKNIEEIRRLSHLLMAQSQLIIAITILPAMVYCSIFKTDLKLAAGLIAITLIRYTQRTQYIIFSFPVYYEKKTKVFLYQNLVVLAVNLILLYFLVPVWGAYGAITAILVSQSLQVIGIYLYQRSIVDIPWNLNKLLIYPFTIMILTALLEVIKIKFNIDPFIVGSLVVLSILLSLVLLYKNEIMKILTKQWR